MVPPRIRRAWCRWPCLGREPLQAIAEIYPVAEVYNISDLATGTYHAADFQIAWSADACDHVATATGTGGSTTRRSASLAAQSFPHKRHRSTARVPGCVSQDRGLLLPRCHSSLPVHHRLPISSQRVPPLPQVLPTVQRLEARNRRRRPNLGRYPRRGSRLTASRCPVTIGVFRPSRCASEWLRGPEQRRQLRALQTARALPPGNGCGCLSRRLRPGGVPRPIAWVGTAAAIRARLSGPVIGSVACANRTLILSGTPVRR